MYNTRYHIASLAAVFLALALGLVLGGLVVQRGTLDDQQDALVEGLQDEFQTLRSQNDELEAANEVLSAYATDKTSQWLDGRLQGRTIVVLTNSGREDGLRDVTDAVEAADGQVAVVTMTKPRFGLDDESVRSRLTTEAVSEDELMASVVASLAAEWSAPLSERPVTDALVEAGSITLSGFPMGVSAAGFVDIASPDGKSDSAAVALATKMHDLGIPAVGAETQASDTGKAAQSAGEGIGGVDSLGTIVGRYSLVALLTGAQPGHYGTDAGAQAAYPALAIPSE